MNSPKPRRCLLDFAVCFAVAVAAGCVVPEQGDEASEEVVGTIVAVEDTEDPGLEALADNCRAGDGSACDDLWGLTEVDSDLERLAATCGFRIEIDDDRTDFGDCASVLPGNSNTTTPTTETTTSGTPSSGTALSSAPPSSLPLIDPERPLLGSPSNGEWIVILLSVSDEDGGRATAIDRAALVSDRARIETGVFSSDDFAALNPGFWVVYTGPFGSADDALDGCEKLRSLVPDCYHRQVGQG